MVNGKKVLTTPVSDEDLEGIKIGDIIYMTGRLVTCRDVAHRRVVKEHMTLPVDIRGAGILHAGPIIRPLPPSAEGRDQFEMVNVGPTTSMRMEMFEKEFVEKTGVKLVVGKGGMGPNTEYACKNYKALQLVFPAGNAVWAATRVEEIEDAQWRDLGMPETLWVCRVKEFGPLIVAIDTTGANYFEKQKVIYNQRKEEVFREIAPQLGFIK
jgi:L(+)-tartrate dehydratase beta subunit